MLKLNAINPRRVIVLNASLLLCIACGCTSFYPMNQAEESLLRSEPGESLSGEVDVTAVDGWAYKFSKGDSRIIERNLEKYIEGTVVVQGKLTLISLPLTRAKTIQMNKGIVVYTTDGRAHEYQAFEWAFYVRDGIVESLGGTRIAKDLRNDHSTHGRNNIPISSIERIEVNRVDGLKTVVTIGGTILAVSLVYGVYVLIDGVINFPDFPNN